MPDNTTEYWLAGPIKGVPDLLQPVAHTLLQASRELDAILQNFPTEFLWEKPAALASVGFHLKHIDGFLDRLLTYAKGQQLNAEQLNFLQSENATDDSLTAEMLLKNIKKRVDKSIEYLKTVDPKMLTEKRGVGRKQIPSTVIGLLFHAAEHTMRHTGQLLVTARILTPHT